MEKFTSTIITLMLIIMIISIGTSQARHKESIANNNELLKALNINSELRKKNNILIERIHNEQKELLGVKHD